MGRKRKYPTTRGYYVYVHVTPEKDCYFGKSKQQPVDRWKPSEYKDKSLYPYIEQFGWDGIEHRVLFDNLTARQAEVLEDWFIKKAKLDGFCINYRRSGGIERDNKKEWQREYDRKRRQTEEYKEWQREYQREYRERPENRKKQREYMRQYRLKKKLEKNS